MMQWIAILTMLIDHIGYVFFPDQPLWRIVGRISFPIYAYALVQGHLHTSNKFKYITRLLGIAVVSQIPYQLALNPHGMNIVWTLWIAVIVLNMFDKVTSKMLASGIILCVCMIMEVIPFDYGSYGLLLVLIFRYATNHTLVIAHMLLNMVYLLSNQWILQTLSVVPTLIIVYGPILWERLESARISKWLWRSFYPLHLCVIAIWKWVL
ncbi:TraX family protein [Paenibacillus sp. CMAA1364]